MFVSASTELEQELSTLAEKLSGGFVLGDKVFPGFTPDAASNALEVIGHILHSVTIHLYKGFRRDVFEVVDWISADRLAKAKFAKYSAKHGAKLVDRHLGKGQSKTQIIRIREKLSALGCFSIESRDFGQTGRKHATELFDVNVPLLLKVAAALIQLLKGQLVNGCDGWQLYRPSHGCAFLARLWSRLIRVGSIFSPLGFAPNDTEVSRDDILDEISHADARYQAAVKDLLARGETASQRQKEAVSSLFAKTQKLRDDLFKFDLSASISAIDQGVQLDT